MAFLNHIDVSECEALYRDNGTVTAVNDSNYTLDVKIGDVTYEGVDIHYHCRDSWVAQNHPHSNTYKEEMLGVFKVDDAVLVMCEDDGTPVYVIGFPDGPRPCGGVIVLFATSNGSYDYWNWSLSEEAGVHEDPNFPFPTTPSITSLWWTCNNLVESENYTQSTPALFSGVTGNCSDVCGLINFDDDDCCGSPNNVDDESLSWNVCPCGGDPENDCKKTIQCSNGLFVNGFTDETEVFNYGGCPSSSDRTGSTDKSCTGGHSWKMNTLLFDTEMSIGRTIESGSESKNVCVIKKSTCGPYLVRQDCCDGTNCSAPGDPYNCGGGLVKTYYECMENPTCSRWIVGLHGGWASKYTTEYELGGGHQGGCVDCICRQTSANYNEVDATLSFEVSAAGKSTQFLGSFSDYFLAGNNSSKRTQTYGYPSESGGFSCQECDTGIVSSSAEDYSQYIYNETSYGIGWSKMVSRDDRFAVLLPRLSLAVSGQTIDGDAETVIAATTEIMLRIVSDSEWTFELASEIKHDVLSSMPNSRDDIGIKPNCWAKDYLPYDITLRGFHWINDSVLFVSFVLEGDFYAFLFEESDSLWVKTRLSSFESFVVQNSLEGYNMYLGGL